jgi:ABC-2 type transport system ATP-binding protein
MSTRDRQAVAVALDRVRTAFGSTLALDDVTLDVARGEMFGVIGPDGAGKTTLLRLICGLIAPDRGTVRLFGDDPFRTRRAATAAIGYVSQQFSLYGDLSVDENVEFFARLHGVHDFAARRDRLLDLTGLVRFRGRLAERLSGGMKQKLALACTLVHEPPLLVLDEPTTGVDPVSRREFWKLLAEFVAQGLTIVLATPYLDEAERCRRVVMLNEGRRLALDDPSRLRAALGGIVLEVAAPSPRRVVEMLGGAFGPERVQLFGDRVHVHLDEAADGRAVADRIDQAGLGPAAVRTIAPSLEDVFIQYMKDTAGRPVPAAFAAANGAWGARR